MAKLDCSEGFGGAKGTGEFYCVETKKVYSKHCLARVHPLECKKLAGYTFEEIDYEHAATHKITAYLLNTAVAAVIGLLFVSRTWTDNYFRGEPVCPSVGSFRHALSYWDMNLFYWSKTSTTTYCDIEDSFWRFFLDSWFRGVVTSSDSWLLIWLTLPKALLFKLTLVKVMQPSLGFVYAAIAVVLQQLVYFGITEANAFMNFYNAQTTAFAANHTTLVAVMKDNILVAPLLWLAGKAWAYFKSFLFNSWALVQQKRTWFFATSSMFFKAMAHAGALRLPYRYVMEKYFPMFIGTLSTATFGDLMLEVIIFYSLSMMCAWTNKKLDGIFGAVKKAAAPAPPNPITKLRSMPHKSFKEGLAYYKGRSERLFASYKGDAGGVFTYFDTVFTAVVTMRCFSLLVSRFVDLGAALRTAMTALGLTSLLADHDSKFKLVTGYDGDHVYYSDILATLGLNQAYASALSVVGISKQVAVGTEYHPSEAMLHAYEFAWRLILPMVLYQLNKRYTAWGVAQEKAWADKWFKKDGGEGSYKGWLEANGCHTWKDEEPVKESKTADAPTEAAAAPAAAAPAAAAPAAAAPAAAAPAAAAPEAATGDKK
eukprot:TRINITY_DN4778_c0_g1_i1.p1 TRINITY_DN4778_c0_g1~~TRINITY_DN4778_c0_g1_i1.p1  ORF type:complete len:630 (+),score=149.78 TRINITY_DN4778_c0_g1_i1:102-1892(+)